jgi:hypothetical protein
MQRAEQGLAAVCTTQAAAAASAASATAEAARVDALERGLASRLANMLAELERAAALSKSTASSAGTTAATIEACRREVVLLEGRLDSVPSVVARALEPLAHRYADIHGEDLLVVVRSSRCCAVPAAGAHGAWTKP